MNWAATCFMSGIHYPVSVGITSHNVSLLVFPISRNGSSHGLWNYFGSQWLTVSWIYVGSMALGSQYFLVPFKQSELLVWKTLGQLRLNKIFERSCKISGENEQLDMLPSQIKSTLQNVCGWEDYSQKADWWHPEGIQLCFREQAFELPFCSEAKELKFDTDLDRSRAASNCKTIKDTILTHLANVKTSKGVQ